MTSNKIGIVLAGGEATRFPNKLFMPTFDGRVVIESGIHFLKSKAECRDIVVVSDGNGVVETMMRAMRHRDLRFVRQPKAFGVVDAIQRATIAAAGADRVVVVFGDNWYENFKFVESNRVNNEATVLTVPSNPNPFETKMWSSLDIASGSMWRVRENDLRKYTKRLAGYLNLNPSSFSKIDRLDSQESSLVDLLNEVCALPVHITDVCWFDLGTPEAYLEFAASFHLHLHKTKETQ